MLAGSSKALAFPEPTGFQDKGRNSCCHVMDIVSPYSTNKMVAYRRAG
jgi:hypothetical protein